MGRSLPASELCVTLGGCRTRTLNIALSLARGLAFEAPLALPAALVDIDRRTRFILEIDGPQVAPILVDRRGQFQWVEWGKRLAKIAAVSAAPMPTYPSRSIRSRWRSGSWAGCINAAKTIDSQRPNTPADRTPVFGWIDEVARTDDVSGEIQRFVFVAVLPRRSNELTSYT